MTSDTTRRSVLGAVPALAAAGVPNAAVPAVAGNADTDPIFEALDRHRDTFAQQEKMRAFVKKADGDEAEAWEVLLNTPATTLAGMKAKLEHIATTKDHLFISSRKLRTLVHNLAELSRTDAS